KKVINHCKAVRDVAVRIAEKADADIKLVEAGALLHDIGRGKTHSMNHGTSPWHLHLEKPFLKCATDVRTPADISLLPVNG
ncbi:MAG: HDIG domain-containing protein, partial [Pirellulaceae bacterium]